MIEVNIKQRLIDDVAKDLSNYEASLFLTLNALTNDKVKFEGQIEQLIYWLNCYCYGRNFKNKKKRLKSVGACEIGTANQGLHTHLIIMHNNDTKRTIKDIEQYIRRKWYSLIKSKSKASKSGNLVDLKFAYDVQGCIKYITKTIYHQPNQFNLQYF
jgi:predicted metal-binding protein